MPDKTDFYQRLNIDTGASEEAIKQAYRQAVKKAHPDVNKKKGATQLFLDIQEAYKILTDPDKKKLMMREGIQAKPLLRF
jgi:DnaJ-class molecular chaperone